MGGRGESNKGNVRGIARTLPENLPLQIQLFGNFTRQTLVLLHVANLQTNNEAVTPAQITALFLDLRLPPPPKVGNNLASLKNAGFAVPLAHGRWATTPLGKDRIRELMVGTSDAELASVTAHPDDALFGDMPHALLPPAMAPIQWRGGIGRFLKDHPFDRNVFGISRFPRKDHPDDPIGEAHKACRRACKELGLEYHLASDKTVEEQLFNNVAAIMWACHYGIAIIEDTVAEGSNYNVALEVGAMLITGRPCLLLKDASVKKPPSDLVAHIYDSVDIKKPDTIEKAIRGWAKDRLGLS